MYFMKKKRGIPRSDLRTRLEEHTAWREQPNWFADEKKEKNIPGSYAEIFPLRILKGMHSFLFLKIIAVCLFLLLVFFLNFLKMPFSTALLEKIHFVTTWEMDFKQIGRQALPVVKKMWEGSLEGGIGQQVMAPRGDLRDGEEAGEEKPIFFPPVEGELEQTFGLAYNPFWQRDEMSYGIILRPFQDRHVRASAAGLVQEIREHPSYGLCLTLKHALDKETYYGYLAEVFVGEGEKVEQGQEIALAGSAPGGNKTILYFELREGGRPLDPLPLLAGSQD